MYALMPITRFGEAVESLIRERGCTLRSQRQRTGIAHSTVKSWIDGVQPSMDAVIAFARGFGLDVNEWLALAGYDPITPSTAEAIETLRRRGQDAEEPFDVAQYDGAAEISENDRQIINEVVRGLLADRRSTKKP
jgi:hypothetical protein